MQIFRPYIKIFSIVLISIFSFTYEALANLLPTLDKSVDVLPIPTQQLIPTEYITVGLIVVIVVITALLILFNIKNK